MRKFILFLTLAVAVSCKTPPASELNTDVHEAADPEPPETVVLSTPFLTSVRIDARVLTGNEIPDYIGSPLPGATYRLIGTLPVDWRGDISPVLLEEVVGNRRMIYLVCFDGTETRQLYTTVVHHEESGKVLIKSVIAGEQSQTINRYDFRTAPVMEVHDLYTFDHDPGADAVLPLLDTESGTAVEKDDIRAALEDLAMDGDWEFIEQKEIAEMNRMTWVTQPCGEYAWFYVQVNVRPGDINHPGYAELDLFPILTFSYQDTYDWEIAALSWENYGNYVELQAKAIAGDGDPEIKTYVYKLFPDNGVRVFNEQYALSAQVGGVLPQSDEECPDDDEY